ncbi:class E basic helix-loop-helix protein 41-like [Dipodomys merriami]|uniref:class E basic helix-loop-helix protein 41-like n=1 Tax=Dipodomys merriami TaxID=94247 RepID=UPI003855B9ED
MAGAAPPLPEALLRERRGRGLGFPGPLPAGQPRRSAGRDGKDAHKLPHRLIEKKRRDRINDCIAQLKDLLPEHLKLTTLGHLEKAVVLELTLKHLTALTALAEQQRRKILALQAGPQRSALAPEAEAEAAAFHAGFRTCAREVLQLLAGAEARAPRELLRRLRAVAARPAPVLRAADTDTDTDSGYGGDEARPEPRVKPEPPPPPAPQRPPRGPDAAWPCALLAPAPAPLCVPLCVLAPLLGRAGLGRLLGPAAPPAPHPAAAAFPRRSSAGPGPGDPDDP